MNERKPTEKEREATLEELKKYGREESEKLFKAKTKSDFDERNLASGNKELLDKSDSELFPDEIEEYTEKERKPKIIVNNESKKQD
ncbi:hypothetical protein OQJ68_15165 [Microbulbifer thermotolerans]|uniref:Uncharacterized protein n=1 Tax=Microbulbifer thermotolerans TaxID=252514 RepID=A0AB35I350_MICTH|nr:hypothetical protein [Microbulbifer thermotolerans]MCX2803132.1 hypothetical protein [Microbulbifer thermotolerans]